MPQPLPSYRSSSTKITDADSIATDISRVLAQASLSSECKLAYVRVYVLFISSLLDVLVFFFPQTLIGQESVSPSIALIGLSATGIAIGILWLLRQPTVYRWQSQLQIAIPLFDGTILAIFITNIWHVLGGIQPQIIANIAAFCCLLAVSGGMRLKRRSSVTTTALALVNFAYAAYLFKLELTMGLFAGFTVLGTGFLGLWISNIVRRQVQNEAGRFMMERFLPRTVAEKAFEAPLELLQNPRSCEVTIVVTDLRSFTQYAEKLEPEKVLAFLNRLQGMLSEIVERYGGWVDKFMGDGMLAVFGALDPLNNHAEQALQAAGVMLTEIETISPLAMGVGIHSGPVVAGCLGAGPHLEFTVIGDTVNVAARIEALTKQMGYPMLVSQATAKQLPTGSLLCLGSVSIRGRKEPLALYTLPGLVNVQTAGT